MIFIFVDFLGTLQKKCTGNLVEVTGLLYDRYLVECTKNLTRARGLYSYSASNEWLDMKLARLRNTTMCDAFYAIRYKRYEYYKYGLLC